jgi:formate dehydrogenase beta subunit
MAEKAILYDATRCTACRGCQALCKEWNENDQVIPAVQFGVGESNRGSYENPVDLSPKTWLKIKFSEVEHYGKVDWLFSRQACMHCTNAACIKVCPTKALHRDPVYGIVALDESLCSGCGYCEEFCPFHVPRLQGSQITGIRKASKCVMCTQPELNRLDAGQEPACVKTCPTGALQFGDRDAMVATGKMKVAALQAQGFTNATFYGENELGGLHVLYVLNDTPDKYGLPVNPRFPDVATAWQDVIQPLGMAVTGLAVVGLVINYIVAREAKMTRELPGPKERKNGDK